MYSIRAATGFYLWTFRQSGCPRILPRSPAISAWQARLLEPSQGARALAGRRRWPIRAKPAVLAADVVSRARRRSPGTIKYLRIMEQVPRPWSVYRAMIQRLVARPVTAISLLYPLSVKVLHASFRSTRTGRRGSRFRRAEHLLRPWTPIFSKSSGCGPRDFKPGESRSCIGCTSTATCAARRRPDRPLGQCRRRGQRPSRVRQPARGPILTFATDVQAIFRPALRACHTNDCEESDGGSRLTGHDDRAVLPLLRKTAIHKDLVGLIQEFSVPTGGRRRHGLRAVRFRRTLSLPPQEQVETCNGRPLPRQAVAGELHPTGHGSTPTPVLGSHFGRRNLASRNQPDFRPVHLESPWHAAEYRIKIRGCPACAERG